MSQSIKDMESSAGSIDQLRALLKDRDPSFWDLLSDLTSATQEFDELFRLSTFRKKAIAAAIPRTGNAPTQIRLAIVGAYSLYPLQEIIAHLFHAQGFEPEIFAGAYDNYVAEISDEQSELYAFKPELVLVIPAGRRCRYSGRLSDPPERPRAEALAQARELLNLASALHDRCGAEILLCNFMLPGRFDPGVYRTRSLGSDWAFKKAVNLELGIAAPPYVHICDLEHASYRRGALAAADDRAWFESKQLGSPSLLVDLGREVVHLARSLRTPPKKVLILDLDNTLWGGVIGDDGLEGLELGGTSPRGEAFQAFQRYVASLKQRGVLLAVCSKNEENIAQSAFTRHPECILKLEDFVCFKANWQPKSDNIRAIASELNLGLDSFVFVDDNPAEIEIVRQFVPEVMAILLPADPSAFVAHLQDARLFEPRSITEEDAERTEQYRSEKKREELKASTADMPVYLRSLEMTATVSVLAPLDVPRLSQLINKSNQFNLTTRRRTEAEVQALIGDPGHAAFSVRLRDRFGDHGLISVFIGRYGEGAQDPSLMIDTWLMSCRVLKRQVEELVLNEAARLAQAHGCGRLLGRYIPTPKNEMVRNLLPELGFKLCGDTPDGVEYELALDGFRPHHTEIAIERNPPEEKQ